MGKSYSELKLGWLSPDGSFIETGMYGHLDAARKLVDKFDYSSFTDKGDIIPCDDILILHGWCSIYKSELDHKFRFAWRRFLTDSQKDFLKSYYDQKDWIDSYTLYRLESEM